MMLRDGHDSGSAGDLWLPPHNLEAERYCLGAMLMSEDAATEVLAILKAEDFYRDAHQLIFAAIRDLATEGKPHESIHVHDRLVARKEAERVGGWEYLGEVGNAPPHAANALHHASLIRDDSDRRAVIVKCRALEKSAHDRNVTTDRLVSEAQSTFFAVGDRAATTEMTLHEAASRAIDSLDSRWKGEDPGVGLPWRKLNDLLSGLLPGRLYIVAARPGNGKSALLLNVADHAAMTNYGGGLPVMFFTLEMLGEELGERYLSGRAHVHGYAFKKPYDLMKTEHMTAILKAYEEAAESRLRIDEAEDLTISQIAARSRRCKQRHGLGLVMVDYLQLINGDRTRGENRQEEVARISRGLGALAKQLRVPVIAACQLNRAVEGRTGAEARPRLSDLRESGQIEQDAHAVLLLHRPGLTDPMAPQDITEVIVAKNRSGSTGLVELKFVKGETRFEDAPEMVPQPEIQDQQSPF